MTVVERLDERDRIHLYCAEFLGATIATRPEEVFRRYNAERITRILTEDYAGKKRWQMAVRAIIYGEDTVLLIPIVVIMNGDFDGYVFQRRAA